MSENTICPVRLSEDTALRFRSISEIALQKSQMAWRIEAAAQAEILVLDATATHADWLARSPHALTLLIGSPADAAHIHTTLGCAPDERIDRDFTVSTLMGALERLALRAQSRKLRELLSKQRNQWVAPSPTTAPVVPPNKPAPAALRYRVTRWTMLPAPLATPAYQQAMAAMTKQARSVEDLASRCELSLAQVQILLQFLQQHGTLKTLTAQTDDGQAPPDSPLPAAPPQAVAPVAQGFFGKLARWIGQSRSSASSTANSLK